MNFFKKNAIKSKDNKLKKKKKKNQEKYKALK